jgi:hypothetical protein
MTVREIYDSILVELNKENSQSFTVEEFNYVINKSILALVNEKYNFFGVNQQLSDDLRVLSKYQNFSVTDTTSVDGTDPTTAVFNPTSSYVTDYNYSTGEVTLTLVRDILITDTISFEDIEDEFTIDDITDNVITIAPLEGGSLPDTLDRGINVLVKTDPVEFADDDITNDRTLDLTFKSSDYMHITACNVIWKAKRPVTDAIMHIKFPARRLTQDMHSAIQNNAYMSPAPNRPYHQLFNSTGNTGGLVLPTSPNDYKSLQNKPKVRIYLGNKTSVMELRKVIIEYIKIPSTVTLLDSDIYTADNDESQIIELPDYLKNEVVKRCAIYLLEKSSDPRVQTQPAFNGEMQSIPMNMQIGGMRQQQQQNFQQNQNTNQQ